jgi:hypothetical protein
MEKEMPKNFLQDMGSEHVDQWGGDSREQEPYEKSLLVILRRQGLAA